MAKHMITRMWIWGAIVMTMGGTLAAAISFVMIAHVGDITAGNRVRFVPDDFLWTTIGLMTFGGIVAGVGYLLQLAAWIGAVFNATGLRIKSGFESCYGVGLWAISWSCLRLAQSSGGGNIQP